MPSTGLAGQAAQGSPGAPPSATTTSQTDWRVALLGALGAPVTKPNLAFLGAWQASEGGSTHNAAKFNYMNLTTEALSSHGLPSDFPFFTSSNGSHIVVFPDFQTGIDLTAQYIQAGQYPVVTSSLKAGDPLAGGIRTGIIGDLSTWLSGSRTSPSGQQYGARILSQAGAGYSAAGSSTDIWGRITGAAEGVAGGTLLGGPLGAVAGAAYGAFPGLPGGGIASGVGSAAKDAVNTVTAVPKAIGWVFGNWDRMLEVGAGLVLMAVGLVLMAQRTGAIDKGTQAAGAVASVTPAGFEARAATRAATSRTPSGRPKTSRQANVRPKTVREYPAGERPRRRPRSYDPASSDIPF